MRSEHKLRWDRAHYGGTGRPTGHHAHFTSGQIAKMRALRAAGMKVYEIADLMDVGAMSVSQRTKDVRL